MAFSFGRGAVHTVNRGKDSRSDRYGGVLRSAGDFRLIVTLNGSRYCLQHKPFKGAGWNVQSWALFLPVLISRLPDGLAFDDLGALPDDPAQVPKWV